MKRLYSLSLLALLCLTGGRAWAQTTFSQGNFAYTVTSSSAKTVSVAMKNNTISGDIVIPSSVTYSGNTYTVTSVSDYAFSDARDITSVSIPGTVTSLGNRAFGDCHGLTKITFEESSQPLSIVCGYYGSFQYCDADKSVYAYRNLTPNEENSPFYEVTSVTVGGKATTVTSCLFKGQDKLTSITIGSSVKSIGNYAFNGCGDRDGVVELVLTLGNNVTSIGTGAFYGCEALKSLTLPSTMKLVDNCAFQYSGIYSLVIPAAVDSIGERAFGDCHNLADIHIENCDRPLKMKEGYYGPFNFSDADKTVYIGRNLKLTEDGNPFINATSVVFSNNVTAINKNLLYGSKKLTSITIGSGVTTIGDGAFYDCGDDEGVVELELSIGKNVTNIGMNAFYSCEALRSLTLPSTLKLVSGYAFSKTGISSIVIPAAVDSLGDRVFGECPNLASIHIENNSKELIMRNGYYGTFAYSDAEKTVYVGRNLKLNDKTTAFGDNAISVVFSNNVTLINDKLFSGDKKLNSISIGSGVTTIGRQAFYDCGDDDGVVELVLSMGRNVTAINEEAFRSCEGLRSLTLSPTLKFIGGYAFSNTNISSLVIPAAVDSIGDRTFGECPNLTSIRIEDSSNKLKISDGYYGTFAYSDAEKSIYLGRNLKLVNDDEILSNITDIEFGTKVTSFAAKLLNSQQNLNSIKAPWTTPISVTDDHFSENIFNNTILIVPSSALNAYRAHAVWKKFKNIQAGNFTEEEEEVITMTGSYATFSSPQDLDFSGTTLRAYIASGFNKATNQVLLTPVTDVPAGTGVFLVGTPGETYQVPHANSMSYYVNLFQPNLQQSVISSTSGSYSNYVFDDPSGNPGFYPISGSTTLQAQTAYLQLPTSFVTAGVKVSIIFEEDVIDGIEEFRMDNVDEAIYDLAGRRLNKMQKGINIVNGRKVLR